MNNNNKQRPKSLIILYLLIGYVLTQFCWWAYLLINLKHSQGESIWMVIGEGSIFLLLLLLGAIYLIRMFRKEIALSQQQKNFLLSITHELKSPIASLKLYLQTLKSRDLDKAKQQQVISNALSDTERLTNLVENFLIARKIDTGEYMFYREKIDLSGLIKNELKRFPPGEVRSHIDDNIYIEGDKLALSSVIINLVENGIKYAGTPVIVKLYMQDDNNIALDVIDEGPGISDEEKGKIFNKFYRPGDENTRKAKGTGLGLFITRYIIEEHWGSILVKNNSPKGSIFEVRFRK